MPAERTDRPVLAPYPAELSTTEEVAPLSAAPSGERVTVDRAQLDELAARLAEALGAIERLNLRVRGGRLLWDCTADALATGMNANGCQKK